MLKRQKIIDLRLQEEKFYFPGETIKVIVLVNPKNSIKVNSIQLRFTGLVFIHLKEKETTTLFNKTQCLQLEPKTVLDVKEHTFHFDFIVPDNLNLPSSMEFGKKAHIRYTISAVLDRPMVPESLCPKVDYAVSLLEYIDVETPQFLVPQEKIQDVMLPHAKYNQKCMVRVSIPRFGFTRGDIVPLKVTVDHFTSFSRKNGVSIELVRTVEIRTSRHTVFKETVLRTLQYDLCIKSPHPSQTDQSQLLIPTSTPPSIRYKDKVIRFHYKVRVIVSFNDQHPCKVDLPIVIGTWPRAAIPIEDDDEDDDNEYENNSYNRVTQQQQQQQQQFSDDDDDVEIESLPYSIDDLKQRNSMIQIGRADSLASRTSNKSYNSTSTWHSWDNHNMSNNNLSRNTSLSTTLSSPERLSNARSSVCSSTSEYPARSFDHSPKYYNSSISSRHSSLQSNNINIINNSNYNNIYNNNNSNSNNNYNYNYNNNVNNNNYHHSTTMAGPLGVNRLRYSKSDVVVDGFVGDDVPTHILEPVSPNFISSNNTSPASTTATSPTTTTTTTATTMTTKTTTPPTDTTSTTTGDSNIKMENYHQLDKNRDSSYSSSSYPSSPSSSYSSSSESSLDSDDDDLLAIIQRKKKKERKELRKKKALLQAQ